MDAPERILVTSALPYANGPIHLGHLAGAYLPADIYVRFQKLKKRDIVFICGSDEHGVPITILAEKRGVTPKAIVDEFHKRNKKAFEAFGIQFDNYSRTSLPAHHKTSQAFFLKLHQKGLLTEKTIEQFYCEHCQRFLADRYVEGTCPHCKKSGARGDQCEACGKWIDQTTLIEPSCAICGTQPVLSKTSHWFLKLGDFQDQIKAWLDTKITWKSNVLNFCRGWLSEGLRDRAVTRDLSWGVPVPLKGYENKVLYVWFDAPIGYISSTVEWAQNIGQPDRWKDYWQKDDTRLIHFIGKDNIVFHAIVWPAILMGNGEYILPSEIPANEFLNLEGEKLSTSKNYAVWLEDYLEKFPPDPLRYTLAVNAPEAKDADFNWTDFQSRNNNELADILGNFLNRSLTFIKKHFQGKVPEKGTFDALDTQMRNKIHETRVTIAGCLEAFEVRKAIFALIDLARFANKYFNDKEPWLTVKSNRETCATTLHLCAQVSYALAILMEPFLPFSAETLWRMLNLDSDIHQQNWDDAGQIELPVGHQLGKLEILFPKIEDEVIEPEIQRLKQIRQRLVVKSEGEKDSKTKAEEPMSEQNANVITYDDFSKVNLRVAKIIEAERVPKADKLLKIQVDLGAEKRQIVAGIAQQYDPADLIDKLVVVVTNLQPVKLRGVESNGMLLAAAKENGELSVVTLDRAIEPGTTVR
ncbi:methionine--tRNA ligase [candidate division KSB1 bacterium]|nr:methionine--tRNA ligase [candidate division KSB1 bacterium]